MFPQYKTQEPLNVEVTEWSCCMDIKGGSIYRLTLDSTQLFNQKLGGRKIDSGQGNYSKSDYAGIWTCIADSIFCVNKHCASHTSHST